MPRIKDIAGIRYGKLTAHKIVGQKPNGSMIWCCACECGGQKDVGADCLVKGSTKSCGCALLNGYKAACLKNTKHGHAVIGRQSPEYRAWHSMRQRSAHDPIYVRKGIRVSPWWDEFTNFLSDMGPKPSPKHSLDRIDNDGNYEPGNVRWATPLEQAHNRDSNRVVTHKGVTAPLVVHCRNIGIPTMTVYQRLKAGYPMDRALDTTPLPTKGRRRNDHEKSNSRKITIGGRTQHLAQWCREFGIKKGLFQYRVRQGMSEEEALKNPVRQYRR